MLCPRSAEYLLAMLEVQEVPEEELIFCESLARYYKRERELHRIVERESVDSLSRVI
jgi:hypothetical protein